MIVLPTLPDDFETWSPAEQRAFAVGVNYGSAARGIAIVDALFNAAFRPEVAALGTPLAITTLAAAFDQDVGSMTFEGEQP